MVTKRTSIIDGGGPNILTNSKDTKKQHSNSWMQIKQDGEGGAVGPVAGCNPLLLLAQCRGGQRAMATATVTAARWPQK